MRLSAHAGALTGADKLVLDGRLFGCASVKHSCCPNAEPARIVPVTLPTRSIVNRGLNSSSISSYNARYRTRFANACYAFAMSRETEALLDAFDHLPADEKRAFTEEVLRRSMPYDSGPIADEEI